MKGGSKTSSFSTEGVSSDRTCIIKGCKITHLNKRGKAVNTLSLCNSFKNLSFKEKCDYLTKGKACRSCTTPGHISKNCKGSSTCQAKLSDGSICNTKEHHTLLHPPDSTGGAKTSKKSGKSESYQTDSTAGKPAAEAPPSPGVSCLNTSSAPAVANVVNVPP